MRTDQCEPRNASRSARTDKISRPKAAGQSCSAGSGYLLTQMAKRSQGTARDRVDGKFRTIWRAPRNSRYSSMFLFPARSAFGLRPRSCRFSYRGPGIVSIWTTDGRRKLPLFLSRPWHRFLMDHGRKAEAAAFLIEALASFPYGPRTESGSCRFNPLS